VQLTHLCDSVAFTSNKVIKTDGFTLDKATLKVRMNDASSLGGSKATLEKHEMNVFRGDE